MRSVHTHGSQRAATESKKINGLHITLYADFLWGKKKQLKISSFATSGQEIVKWSPDVTANQLSGFSLGPKFIFSTYFDMWLKNIFWHNDVLV